MKRFLQPALAVALLFFAATTTLSAQHVLSTPLDFDNGSNGVMFDIDASADLRITGIDVIPLASNQTATYEVWRVTNGGSLVGRENDATAWTLVGSNTVTTPSSTVLMPLGIPLDIEVSGSGPAMGLYITGTGSGNVSYTSGANFGALRAQSQHLQVFEGVGKSYPFGSTFGGTTPGGSSRMFNGRIHYELGSAGDPATLITGPRLSSANGLTFDIRAKEAVTIEGFSLDLNPGTHTLEVWTPTAGGSHVPVTSTPGAWILAGRVDNFVAPVQGVYNVGFDLDVPIAANESRGFYVTTTAPGVSALGADFVFLTIGDTWAFDESIVMESGNGRDYPFTLLGGIGGLCGEVHYRRNIPGDNTTTFYASLAALNGPAVGGGLFFDMAAVGDFVQVNGINARMLSGTHTVELWTVVDRTTHIGKETNASLWNRQGVTTVTVPLAASDTVVSLFSSLRIVLEPGGVQGCYLISTSGGTPFSYDFGTQGTSYASNSLVDLRTGSRSDSPWLISIPGRSADIEVWAIYNPWPADAIVENFSSGSGIWAPWGWFSHLSNGNYPSLGQSDGWQFSNPQPISPAARRPFDADFAVVDTDFSGQSNPVDASLYSPSFDASQGNVVLSFDHYHRPLASSIHVDVWDGAAWNSVLSTMSGTPNPEHRHFDITAATGGASDARVRFRYEGNFDWHWALDNVRINSVGVGQEPRPGLGVMDVNFSRAKNGQPVASNLPGPYFADGHTATPVVFEFEGEPNQPVLLLQGLFNPNGWDFLVPGKLDIGVFNPGSGSFSFLEQLAFGADPGYINSLFLTNSTGSLQLAFPLPPFMVGQTYNFQAGVLSANINIALTNMVQLDVVN